MCRFCRRRDDLSDSNRLLALQSGLAFATELIAPLLLKRLQPAMALAGEDGQERPRAKKTRDDQQVKHVSVNRQE
jgi:hypothetical protein